MPDDVPDDALDAAVADAMAPARDEAVMRAWQNLMDAEHVSPPREEDPLLRRLYDDPRPDADPPP